MSLDNLGKWAAIVLAIWAMLFKIPSKEDLALALVPIEHKVSALSVRVDSLSIAIYQERLERVYIERGNALDNATDPRAARMRGR